MKNKLLLGAGAISVFALGFECGGNFVQNKISKDQGEKLQLITRAFASVMNRAREEGLDEDQISDLLHEELEFMKIVKP